MISDVTSPENVLSVSRTASQQSSSAQVGTPTISGANVALGAADILRTMLPATSSAPQHPSHMPVGNGDAAVSQSASAVTTADLVRMMRREGRAPSLPTVKEVEGAPEVSQLDGSQGGRGGPIEKEKPAKDGCKCGRPLRSKWNGVCHQLKPTCICGLNGPSVVKIGGNVHKLDN